ncbi:MAG: hypothetical protein WC894_04525 [Patescibacteria group bacterium]
MIISSKLPQFIDEVALLLVASTQEVDFYLASNAEINNVFHFKLEKTKYSDREDLVKRGTMVFESGAKFEKLRKLERVNFIREFKNDVKEFLSGQKVDKVYLFAPKELLKDLKKSLPAAMLKKLKGGYEGNFQKEKPFDILKKIIKKPLK